MSPAFELLPLMVPVAVLLVCLALIIFFDKE